MTTAPPSEVPSERFVEQMGNHLLMNLIGPEHTFFHIPTQPAEKTLGYDASLQGFKTLVLQYKRLVPNVPPYTGRIPIDPTQLATLQTKFPAAAQPYAFLGFCLHQEYSTITPLFAAGTGSTLAEKILFLDIHSPTLAARPYPKSINTSLILPVLGSEAFKLATLAARFSECTVGVFELGTHALPLEREDGTQLGNLSLLHAKLPSWAPNNSSKPTPLRGAA